MNILVMDKLGSPKDKKALGMLACAGVKMRFLPAYSPACNPIELMWSKVEAQGGNPKTKTPALD
ncbi:transposase, partial [Shewanella sp. A3A]|nr:transposase [Shewanella ferrihydritica]